MSLILKEFLECDVQEFSEKYNLFFYTIHLELDLNADDYLWYKGIKLLSNEVWRKLASRAFIVSVDGKKEAFILIVTAVFRLDEVVKEVEVTEYMGFRNLEQAIDWYDVPYKVDLSPKIKTDSKRGRSEIDIEYLLKEESEEIREEWFEDWK